MHWITPSNIHIQQSIFPVHSRYAFIRRILFRVSLALFLSFFVFFYVSKRTYASNTCSASNIRQALSVRDFTYPRKFNQIENYFTRLPELSWKITKRNLVKHNCFQFVIFYKCKLNAELFNITNVFALRFFIIHAKKFFLNKNQEVE